MKNQLLAKFRAKIDSLDKDLLKIIAKRMNFSKKIGQLKQKDKSKIKDAKREETIEKKWEKSSEKMHLNKNFTQKILKIILTESRKCQ